MVSVTIQRTAIILWSVSRFLFISFEKESKCQCLQQEKSHQITDKRMQPNVTAAAMSSACQIEEVLCLRLQTGNSSPDNRIVD